MNICLQNNEGTLQCLDGFKICFDENMFRDSVKKISEDISKNYDVKKIGLLGVARGGLPLLVGVSHELGIRSISVMQIKMTNSDKFWDYGDAKLCSECVDDDYDNYLIFEDMVSHGRSANVAIRTLEDKNKKVLSVYSLCMNQDMNNLSLQSSIDVRYMYLTSPQQWVCFFWEKGYGS